MHLASHLGGIWNDEVRAGVMVESPFGRGKQRDLSSLVCVIAHPSCQEQMSLNHFASLFSIIYGCSGGSL